MKMATITKFALAGVALCFWGAWYFLYEKFVGTGSEAANSTHSVLVNDHGTLVFITPSQDHLLKALIAAAIISFVCAVIIDLYERTRGGTH